MAPAKRGDNTVASSRKAVAPAARKEPARRGASGNGKRELNKAQNRAAILKAAREVFAELGYDAATVRDIIRRTRLASGTFYNYFPDKESIFRDLLRESEERRVQWLREAHIRTDDYEHYIEDSFRAYFDYVASDPEMFELLRRNSGSIRAFSDDPVIVTEVRRLRAALEERVHEGILPANIDTAYFASAMFGIAFELAVHMVARDPVDVEGATRFATDLFAGSIERTRRARRQQPPARQRADEASEEPA